MSKFTFLLVCRDGSINLKEFLSKVDPTLRFDFVDGQLECYIEVEAKTDLEAGEIIVNKCRDFKTASNNSWTLDEDYVMDKETYSLYENPLGRYLTKARCF